MKIEFVDQIRTASGGTTAVGGGITAMAGAAENSGWLEWMNQNALGLGVMFTALTFIVYLTSTIVGIVIKLKGRTK